MRKCRDCSADVEPGKQLCPKCKSNADFASAEKKRTRERERSRKTYQSKRTYVTKPPTREPHTDCPYWKTRSCAILELAICRTKECGFYPPVAEERKRKLRKEI